MKLWEAYAELWSQEDTLRFGELLGSSLRAGDVIALVGDLGAGKTTLTQGIAKGMGITQPVNSPTFSLIHEYPGKIPLFHCDPYRLNSPEALYDLGFEEYFERGGVVIVEWANLVEDLLPEERLTITLKHYDPSKGLDEDIRALTLQTAFERLREICIETLDKHMIEGVKSGGIIPFKIRLETHD